MHDRQELERPFEWKSGSGELVGAQRNTMQHITSHHSTPYQTIPDYATINTRIARNLMNESIQHETDSVLTILATGLRL